ncbi:hypothetical protein CMV_021479 [Castanea mollissima]|uniref:Uncharacterized protein n=1 Tax=Castanea mollissima TaxID=60419 RepID=A0A8J4QJS6_9ROSI|nr:hypothetical protein CMV_021479 [Castanea mollissima]
MQARILNCQGIQLPILFAEFVASAFLHNQQLIFKVHERNRLWVLVDWHCISHLDSLKSKLLEKSCLYW